MCVCLVRASGVCSVLYCVYVVSIIGREGGKEGRKGEGGWVQIMCGCVKRVVDAGLVSAMSECLHSS